MSGLCVFTLLSFSFAAFFSFPAFCWADKVFSRAFYLGWFRGYKLCFSLVIAFNISLNYLPLKFQKVKLLSMPSLLPDKTPISPPL